MEIHTLRIFTPQLNRQVEFYTQNLGLELLSQDPDEAKIAIGESVLHLKAKSDTQPYHFAINIPLHAEKAARDWLAQRVDILKDGGIEIHDFDFWQAWAVYFYDADRNIVELISRKSCPPFHAKPFGPHNLLCISEIGVVVPDIEHVYSTLHKQTDIKIYSGSFERFCALGDEQGLFICLNPNEKKMWFPTEDAPQAADFLLGCNIKGTDFTVRFMKGLLHISPVANS